MPYYVVTPPLKEGYGEEGWVSLGLRPTPYYVSLSSEEKELRSLEALAIANPNPSPSFKGGFGFASFLKQWSYS